MLVYWHTEGSFLYVHSTNIYFHLKKGEEQQKKLTKTLPDFDAMLRIVINNVAVVVT